ncbi:MULTISPECIES: NOG1 family protein [unclassified Haladaptatus]|uniref:NOG1 family protein n=1 Tax=unclassified Haladaptatus TaxID=2622732 RepID=UPI00209C4C7C|nr:MULTISPECIES: NOG1 family protein [unclassified Haladaptatus]MCO8244558.1 NOG1 family protein [Haladaptatus sp. AB643]MCO8253820.1 NOG1 family protein [Haladaptatus sp. AB618]
MIFETLPTTPTSEELIDKAFSRATRAGRAKSGIQAQQSMLQTASNILSDNMQNVVTAWPDFQEVDPFYYELADAVVDVDEVRKSLSEIQWASRKTKDIGREYQGKLRGDINYARKVRKQGFARLASIVEEVEDDLARIGEARNDLRTLPDIDPSAPTVVVAGYPNVGKSSFVNTITNARNEIAEYPFTTKGIHVGHFDRQHIRYQIVDTPGLLDRPADERNAIETQAVSAITHLADCILFFVDASAYCGYPLDAQLELRDSVEAEFGDVPVLTVCNKSDLSTDVEADMYMSIEEDDNVTETLDAAVDAIGYEPELPFDG